VPIARGTRWSGFLALLAALACAFADQIPQSPPVEAAEIAPLASKSLLLDVAAAGSRIVVVGERGQVLLSDDQGASWRQPETPTLSLLTAVYFVDARHGWAVGHDEVILRTEDGGEHWARAHFEPQASQPLLDVWFRDADHGVAVGAYSAYFTSADGGRSWQSQAFSPVSKPPPRHPQATKPLPAADVDDEGTQFHLNAISAAANGKLYIAAESGHLYRSDDGGATWLTLSSPYEGSYFGVLPLDGDSVLAFGMRGHLFRSDNAGDSWTQIRTDVTAMLMSGTRLPNDAVVITALAGVLLVSTDGGHTFSVQQQADRKGMSSALLVDGRFITVGEGGVHTRPLK
jgi:photosystem II stability/assembly factor-like uncharacterized protein